MTETPESLSDEGRAFERAGNVAAAEDKYRRRAELTPDDARAWRDLGSALNKLGRFEAAIEATERALSLAPDDAIAHAHLAIILRATGAMDAALASARRALDLDPGNAPHHVLLAELLFAVGDLADGFREYEWRLRIPQVFTPAEQAGVPYWNGAPLSGALLVTGEQGFGDTVEFCRYLHAVKNRAARVVFFVHPPLKTLLRSIGGIEVAGFGDPMQGPFEAAVNVASLPFLYGTTAETVPSIPVYLAPPPERVEHWRARTSIQGFKVGIGWRGNSAGAHDRGRSMALADLAPLASVPGTAFHALQTDATPDELAAWPGAPLSDLGTGFRDFADTAACVANMDLVITTDTALAHVASACGRPVWLLLQKWPAGRWGLMGQNCPWYPSMRLFRQDVAGDWTGPVGAAANALKARTGLA